MGEEDKKRTLELIHRLSTYHSFVVVEHDMGFIRALESPVLMLHQGVVYRTGSFDELIADEQVISVYLGRRKHGKQ